MRGGRFIPDEWAWVHWDVVWWILEWHPSPLRLCELLMSWREVQSTGSYNLWMADLSFVSQIKFVTFFSCRICVFLQLKIRMSRPLWGLDGNGPLWELSKDKLSRFFATLPLIKDLNKSLKFPSMRINPKKSKLGEGFPISSHGHLSWVMKPHAKNTVTNNHSDSKLISL